MSCDSLTFINNIDNYHIKEAKIFHLEKAFYLPSFWVTSLAYLKKCNLDSQILDFEDADNQHYAKAIMFYDHLGDENAYSQARTNNGVVYSTIEHLHTREFANESHSRICNLIRTQVAKCKKADTDEVNQGLNEFLDVIGELHDNVVSHSKGDGYSMAQAYRRNNVIDNIVFSITDNGIGFFDELKGKKIQVQSHQESIEWCIQEGNSSKKPLEDEWAQRLPEDTLDNPYGPEVNAFEDNNGNNHQGLGLARLMQLCLKFSGDLIIITGDSCLMMDNQGNKRYIELSSDWKGVAISVRIRPDSFIKQQPEATEEVVNLMDILRREQ